MAIKSIFPLLFMFFTTSLVGNDLYWIGDNGNWNDPSNWSYTSGGSSINAIPTFDDDVIFDANSFNNKNSIVYFDEIRLR